MARIIQTGDLKPGQKLSQNENDWIYNGLDCCVTIEVRDALLPLLDNTTASTYQFSKELQAPILEMSMRGVRVDMAAYSKALREVRIKIDKISAQFEAICLDGIGTSVAWRSPHQVKKLFYEILNLKPLLKRSADGLYKPTVNREALEKMCDYYLGEPLAIRLLALRDLDKKRQFLETNLDKDNRIRTSYNIAGTNTGRLASSMTEFDTGGNLQNVDRELRYPFIPDPGYKFCNIDLRQGDARNVGAICWNLFYETCGAAFAGSYLDACESGDLHTVVSRMVWHELGWTDDPKQNKKVAEQLAYRADSYRQLAKKLGHGTNYIGTPRTMAKHTKTSTSLITDFQSRYFGAFPCIKEWHKSVREALLGTGQITTLLGRRRSFFGRPDDAATIREATAYEPQSLTADQIDTALLRLHREQELYRIQLLLQVHDSILFQYPEDLEAEVVPWAMKRAQIEMGLAGGRKFVVPTDAKIGWNWGDVAYNKDGSIKDNQQGLMEFNPDKPDTRKRAALEQPRSLRDLLK
jgi:DNA polymerase I